MKLHRFSMTQQGTTVMTILGALACGLLCGPAGAIEYPMSQQQMQAAADYGVKAEMGIFTSDEWLRTQPGGRTVLLGTPYYFLASCGAASNFTQKDDRECLKTNTETLNNVTMGVSVRASERSAYTGSTMVLVVNGKPVDSQSTIIGTHKGSSQIIVEAQFPARFLQGTKPFRIILKKNAANGGSSEKFDYTGSVR